MKKLYASVDASTTLPAVTNAEFKLLPANFIAPVPKDAQKLGSKTYFTFFIYRSFNLYLACNNCPNDFCPCRNYEENPDYIACVDHFDLIYRNCMFDCDHNDNACYADCNRKYDENIQNCPCKPNCPDGCPCPNYQCPETTTGVSSTTRTTTTATEQRNSTVLVVNARNSWKPAKDFRLDLET